MSGITQCPVARPVVSHNVGRCRWWQTADQQLRVRTVERFARTTSGPGGEEVAIVVNGRKRTGRSTRVDSEKTSVVSGRSTTGSPTDWVGASCPVASTTLPSSTSLLSPLRRRTEDKERGRP